LVGELLPIRNHASGDGGPKTDPMAWWIVRQECSGQVGKQTK
jgi:hypothetical protein